MVLFLAMCATLVTFTAAACSFSASTAEISEAKMARDPDGKHPTKVFFPTTGSTASSTFPTPPTTRR
jgi:hypothetical protein